MQGILTYTPRLLSVGFQGIISHVMLLGFNSFSRYMICVTQNVFYILAHSFSKIGLSHPLSSMIVHVSLNFYLC